MASARREDVSSADANNDNGSSNDECGNSENDVFDKIRRLFGEMIYEALQSKSFCRFVSLVLPFSERRQHA